MVRHRFLVPTCEGSIPSTPVSFSKEKGYCTYPLSFLLLSMPSLRQLLRTAPRLRTQKKSKVPAFEGSPFRKGICLRVYVIKPKKPNSAQRKITKVKLSTGRTILAYIPGIFHTLQEHSHVLVRGGRVKDLPGVNYHCVRAKQDFLPVFERRKGRSKYGCPHPKNYRG